jgi:Fe-Mn family superoxide dismutase
MRDPLLSRRHVLAGFALGAGTLALRAAAEPPPTEAGRASDAFGAGRPGFAEQSPRPLPWEELPDFLSREQLALGHAEYVRAVERLGTVEMALSTADRSPRRAGAYAELRRSQVAAANAVVLHELYFGNLAPAKTKPPRELLALMETHMGSFERWKADFTACALAANAWAALVHDPYDGRWHDAIMNGNTDGLWAGAQPLLVCDLAEHAFTRDYQRRDDYVEAFLDHVAWDEVLRRHARAAR